MTSEINAAHGDTRFSTFTSVTSGGAFDTMTVHSTTLPFGAAVQVSEAISASTTAVPSVPTGVVCGGTVHLRMESIFSGAFVDGDCANAPFGDFGFHSANTPIVVQVLVGHVYRVSNHIQGEESEADSYDGYHLARAFSSVHDMRGTACKGLPLTRSPRWLWDN